MIQRVVVPVVVELKEGLFQLFLKTKILSQNVRGLNEGDKCLLASSINHDSRGGSSSRGRAKGRAVSVIYED